MPVRNIFVPLAVGIGTLFGMRELADNGLADSFTCYLSAGLDYIFGSSGFPYTPFRTGLSACFIPSIAATGLTSLVLELDSYRKGE